MNDEIRQAFSHPIERAMAMSNEAPLDRISVRDHVAEVEIGAFQAERDVTQRLRFNIVVEVLPPKVNPEDDVDQILSYDKISEAIAHELGAERLNLLETLAERVADRILSEPQAARVFVRIEKLDRGPGDLGVEIVREEAGADAVEAQHHESSPRIVFASNNAIATAEFDKKLASWLSDELPFVLCVDMPDAAMIEAAASVRDKIALLSIEQNAWRVAGLHPQLAVVASRTELDWAMKNGQPCVWAPSKLVLDAVEKPASLEPVSLARWLAQQLSASELLEIHQQKVGQ